MSNNKKSILNFQGKVIKGLQIGSKFGIATANLEVIGNMPDIDEGVYLVEIRGQGLGGREKVDGILHIGELKTFGREKTCEVHLLDFNQEIYGEVLDVEVLKFVRPTKKFQNADMLYTQIEKDVIGAEKHFLRQKVYQQWKALSETKKEEYNQRSIEKIAQNKDFLSAQNIFIYAPQKEREIDFTDNLMRLFPDKRYFFPKVVGEGEMKFFEVSDYSDLEVGKFGILEPKTPPTPPLKGEEPSDLIFIPSVAVDLDGNRLGKGGGFYDRWLASLENEEIQKIAVLPKFSVVEKIPVETHDQKVDVVIGV